MFIHAALLLLPFTTAYLVPRSFSTNGTAENASHEIEPRVSYGIPAKIIDHPYFARLDSCGGAIIAPEWVITAAHCVRDKRSGYLWVGGECVSNSEVARFDEVIIHPQYDESLHDVALLRLSIPLRFNRRIQAALLPRTSEVINKRYTYVYVGKGMDENNQYPENLQASLMSIPAPVSECVEYFGPRDMQNLSSPLKKEVDNVYLCIKRVNEEYTICAGDSGSPLVYGNVLIGLGSFGATSRYCLNKVAYLVNVLYYVPWIENTIKEMSRTFH